MKKPDSRRRPSAYDIVRPGPDGDHKIHFQEIDGPNGGRIYSYDVDTGRSLSTFASVYSLKVDGTGFFPVWDFFCDQYVEKLEIITPRQFMIYVYVGQLRNRGYRLSLKGSPDNSDTRGLATILGMHLNTLIADLDHLEDALLLHRIIRPDLKGRPNDIVVHTPFQEFELNGQGWLDVIRDRIARKATKTRRQQSLVAAKTPAGKPYSYIDRPTSEQPFILNYKAVAKAFGTSMPKFENFALKFFDRSFHMLDDQKKKPIFESEYRDKLYAEMGRWGITGNAAREKCYVAANHFRRAFCPSYHELLGREV